MRGGCFLATATWLALSVPAVGQWRVPRDRVAAIQHAFDAAAAAPKLRCEVHPVQPALNFAFRYPTGYLAEVPLTQFRGGKHRLITYIRVTPDGQNPVYLASVDALPEPPASDRLPTDSGDAVAMPRVSAQSRGNFVVGEGAYFVEVLIQDDRQRNCRSAWHIQTRRTGSERLLKLRTEPGTVEETRSANLQLSGTAADAKLGRLTVLLHAAPLPSSLSRLQPNDVQRLLNSVVALLEQLPAQSVRLIAFNLDQQAVIFRKEGFAASHMTELQSALQQLELGKVDVQILQHGGKATDLLAGLLAAEMADAATADALVVMGSRARTFGAAAPETLSKLPAAGPPIFYFQYKMYWPIRGLTVEPLGSASGRGGGGGRGAGRGGGRGNQDDTSAPIMPRPMPDSIEEIMKRVKGQTIAIRTPHNLSDAIQRVAARIEGPEAAAELRK
jgi:hypothetical protein